MVERIPKGDAGTGQAIIAPSPVLDALPSIQGLYVHLLRRCTQALKPLALPASTVFECLAVGLGLGLLGAGLVACAIPFLNCIPLPVP